MAGVQRTARYGDGRRATMPPVARKPATVIVRPSRRPHVWWERVGEEGERTRLRLDLPDHEVDQSGFEAQPGAAGGPSTAARRSVSPIGPSRNSPRSIRSANPV